MSSLYSELGLDVCYLNRSEISFLKVFAKLKTINTSRSNEFYSIDQDIYKKEIEKFKSFIHYIVAKLKRMSILAKHMILPVNWQCLNIILKEEENYLKIFDSKLLSQKDLERIQYLFVIFGDFVHNMSAGMRLNQYLKLTGPYLISNCKNSDIKDLIEDYSGCNRKIIKSLVKKNDQRFLMISNYTEVFIYDKMKEIIISKFKDFKLVKNRCLLLADIYLFIYTVKSIFYSLNF